MKKGPVFLLLVYIQSVTFIRNLVIFCAFNKPGCRMVYLRQLSFFSVNKSV